MYDREGDDVLEALEFASDEGAGCPWAGVGYVEMVSPCFGGEARSGGGGDEVPEGGLLAFEFAGFGGGGDPVCDFGGHFVEFPGGDGSESWDGLMCLSEWLWMKNSSR